ncbi:hypothetical protein FNV43_RR06474 [Rhamnella rubrinervis]|uniref:FAD-binding PCMH-type domain-containing protein n=1 Tax=Rhamnella rubrinervis TaxID=2594499 RepID=A0A8K0HDZ8_9ROSA|nr:hypothetical protein FNV43_RR06474 [Rhamnella rubrinervis]
MQFRFQRTSFHVLQAMQILHTQSLQQSSSPPSTPPTPRSFKLTFETSDSTPPPPQNPSSLSPLHESHVQASVICAQKHNLQMKIRSGGHDYEGVSYVSLPASLSSIAEKSKTHGFPAGVCPTVGVGGHFSGGGYGNLMRKYGLSVDHIVDAQIVDVHGRVLDRNFMGEDLFWAITGGGGASFGVVLSYKINLVRVPETVTVFRVERTLFQNATDIVYHYLQVADKLEEDLFIRLILEVVETNQTKDNKKTMRAAFFSHWNTRGCFAFSYSTSTNPPEKKIRLLEEADSEEGFGVDLEENDRVRDPLLTFNPYGGKMAEISSTSSPFPHRAGNLAKIQYAANWDASGAEAEKHYIDLMRKLHEYMTPFVSNSPRDAYFNYKDLDLGINNHNGKASYEEGKVHGVMYFKANFKRLVEIKTKVDPHNFFRNEQSIPTLPNNWGNKIVMFIINYWGLLAAYVIGALIIHKQLCK